MNKNDSTNNKNSSQQQAEPPPIRPFGGPPRGIMGQRIERPKNMWKTLKRIFSYLGAQRFALIGLIVMVILTSVLSLVMPILQKNAINTITIDEGFKVDFV
ncbi:MAG: hypothetical protein FWD71_02705, partial [Oscillospiraceae bacterium]|nr:hypothetical protein [Oscillospiraceae bacterium]